MTGPRSSAGRAAGTGRPTPAQIEQASGGTLPDVIAVRLKILFVGINPSLYSTAIGHHFGRPGNRFWKALHLGGLTDRILSPFEDQDLVKYGCGITNLVERATGRADELSREELEAGLQRLRGKIRRYQPRSIAFLGVTAFRTALRRPGAAVGRQSELFEGVGCWVLPNPSGLNANYQLPEFRRLFGELRTGCRG